MLKVYTIKKPVNPHRPLVYPPAVPELSALCVIPGFDSKGGKNVSSDNPPESMVNSYME